MKNTLKKLLTLFFILIITSPVYSQGNDFNYTSAKLSFWYPEDWLVREHLLLLLMPKEEDLQIQFQLTDEINLDDAVITSKTELKNLFPNDTIYTIKKYTINTLRVREINKNIGNEKIFRLIVEAPDNKIVRIHFISPKDLAMKYGGEIQKILKSLKPLE